MIRKAATFVNILILTMLLFTAFPDVAISHPHVFIVNRIKVVFDDNGVAGFKMQWYFDDMFSSMIAGDYDKNKNGQFEKDEVAVVKKKAFSNTSSYNYFTFINIDQKPFKVKYVTDFSARLVDNKLIYEFFIPCHVTAIENDKHIKVAVYDSSYYTAVYFAEKNPVTLENAGVFEVKTTIKEDKSTSIYYGMVNPWTLFLDFRIKQ